MMFKGLGLLLCLCCNLYKN